MRIVMNRQILSPAVVRATVVSCAAVALFSGCLGSGKTAPARTASAPASPRTEPVPLELGSPPARIVSMNPDLAFVVIDFASRPVPAVGTKVNVYRGDKKVGVVRITEPVHAPLATADIVEGQIRAGDEAR
jgi:hypothetical protein